MPTFVLILTFYAGAFAHTDSIALDHMEFSTNEKCLAAGILAVKTFDTAIKTTKFICVEK